MKALRLLGTLLALALWTTVAGADGGAMLLHQDAGPFTLTLFAGPQPLATGTADLSVMVQDHTTGEVLLDPEIDVTAQPDGATGPEPPVHLTHHAASNRLLQAGKLPLSKAGNWHLTLHVRRGKDVAQVTTVCTVQPDTARTALIWFYVLLPVAVILIFLLHQALKQSQARRLRARESLV
jgi:hypothetical protein